MSYDEKTVERVRRLLLKERRAVVAKRMIGGLCFLADGMMVCGVNRFGLLVRVAPDARTRVLARAHVRPMKFAGKDLAGFVCIDPAGYRTDAALAGWIAQGLKCRAPRTKTPRRRASS